MLYYGSKASIVTTLRLGGVALAVGSTRSRDQRLDDCQRDADFAKERKARVQDRHMEAK